MATKTAMMVLLLPHNNCTFRACCAFEECQIAVQFTLILCYRNSLTKIEPKSTKKPNFSSLCVGENGGAFSFFKAEE